ncbi:MAG: ankyrin repeat domain-containing protein [Chthonomonadales bacterium]
MNRTSVIILIVAALTVAVPSLIVYSYYDRARKGDQLITAISAGNTDKALSLLNSGADPTHVGIYIRSEVTPIQIACYRRNGEVIRCLLSHGVKPWVVGQDKASLIRRTLEVPDNASQQKSNEIMQMLIDHGADVNAVSEFDHSPLIFAIGLQQNDTVKFLIDHGADVNQPNGIRDSPLALSTSTGSTFAVRILLNAGADPAKSGTTFENLIETADKHNYQDIVAILKDAMAKRKAAATTGPKK